jgi:hypothetical protein
MTPGQALLPLILLLVVSAIVAIVFIRRSLARSLAPLHARAKQIQCELERLERLERAKQEARIGQGKAAPEIAALIGRYCGKRKTR